MNWGVALQAVNTLFSVGNVVRSIFSARESVDETSRMQNFYYMQEAKNKEIAAFNERVAVETGERQAKAILDQTKAVYSQQMVQFGRSGFEYNVGSSQEIVATDSISKGLQAAQEAMYNAEIAGIEERMRGEIAVFNSRQQASAAGYANRRARDSLVGTIFKLGQTAMSGMAAMNSEQAVQDSNRSLMDLTRANSESGRF